MYNFWEERYRYGDMPWTLNVASPPIITYIDQLQNRSSKILIPGAGIGGEAQYLFENGFTDITILDISETAIATLKRRLGEPTQIKYVCADFFDFGGKYDLILEQTFFCALNRNERPNYVQKMASLLNDAGTLAGVLFASEFEKPGPPHGGTLNEYLSLFSDHFHIHTMEPCYNSITPRAANEIFIILKKHTSEIALEKKI
ncbi:MAG: methyltransferase domain-containing protein [Saprospiraceae bacterium]